MLTRKAHTKEVAGDKLLLHKHIEECCGASRIAGVIGTGQAENSVNRIGGKGARRVLACYHIDGHLCAKSTKAYLVGDDRARQSDEVSVYQVE